MEKKKTTRTKSKPKIELVEKQMDDILGIAEKIETMLSSLLSDMEDADVEGIMKAVTGGIDEKKIVDYILEKEKK